MRTRKRDAALRRRVSGLCHVHEDGAGARSRCRMSCLGARTTNSVSPCNLMLDCGLPASINQSELSSMSTARKILIVDDDEDLRESLKDQLALHDEFEVFTAGTASKGVDIVKKEHLDLVLLDVGLPDMDGREACKLLRKNGFKSPIVMLTGNN